MEVLVLKEQYQAVNFKTPFFFFASESTPGRRPHRNLQKCVVFEISLEDTEGIFCVILLNL